MCGVIYIFETYRLRNDDGDGGSDHEPLPVCVLEMYIIIPTLCGVRTGSFVFGVTVRRYDFFFSRYISGTTDGPAR